MTYPHKPETIYAHSAYCACGAGMTHGGTPPSEWGRDCPVALREAIAEVSAQRDAAHDLLSDIAALARGEMEPDVRSGGAPVLGEAWRAVVKLVQDRNDRENEAVREQGRADRAEAALCEVRDLLSGLTLAMGGDVFVTGALRAAVAVVGKGVPDAR